MADSNLISLSNNLIHSLNDQTDLHTLTLSLHASHSLRSSSDSDFAEARNSLQDYERKVEGCRKKTEDTKAETVTDDELENLRRELNEVAHQEHLLVEELRIDLERQRAAVVDKKKVLRKQKQEEIKAERKLSMYASVTNVIPNLPWDILRIEKPTRYITSKLTGRR